MRQYSIVLGLFMSSLTASSLSHAEFEFESESAPQSALDCILQPNTRIDVSSPVEGVVDRMLVKRGDAVKKGQVLMRLRSGLEVATAKLAKERAAFNQRTVGRNEDLKSLISDQEQDEIITDAKLAELEYDEAKARLSMRTVKSPINGWVIEKLRSKGEFITEEAFLTIVSIDPLYVEVIAPVSLFGQIKVDDIATVIPERPLSGDYSAKVITVDPVIDPASGTFRVRLELPNPAGKLPSGLKCRIELTQMPLEKKPLENTGLLPEMDDQLLAESVQ